MKTEMDKIRYENAKKRLAKVKSFYTHLIIYLIVNLYIIIKVFIEVPYEHFDLWRFSVPLYWGIGLLIHAFNVFGRDKIFGKEWEERKIKEIMEKEKLRN